MNKEKVIHDRCKCEVLTPEEIAVSAGYSYYCPKCDEDLLTFETLKEHEERENERIT
jgi:hypothetical protein